MPGVPQAEGFADRARVACTRVASAAKFDRHPQEYVEDAKVGDGGWHGRGRIADFGQPVPDGVAVRSEYLLELAPVV